MKKFMTMAAILAALTMTITGCANNANSSNTSDNGSSVTDSNNSADNSGSSDVADEPDVADLSAIQMAANAFAANEWPGMMHVEDPEMILGFFGIDPALCEDYYVSNQMISAQLFEVIIAKPAEGKEADLQTQFDTHFDYIKNDAAFYPDQEPCAEGAVMGKTDNGYLYIIVHFDGQAIADQLMNNPPAEMPDADDGMGGADEPAGDAGYPLAMEMADAAYGAVEWVDMQNIEDPEIINGLFGIDVTLCEEFYFANQLISAQLAEIVIVKPVEGKEADLQAQLDAHVTYVQENAAFYPDQEPAANGTVSGTFDNGYMYIFVHENGAAVEEAVKGYIGG